MAHSDFRVAYLIGRDKNNNRGFHNENSLICISVRIFWGIDIRHIIRRCFIHAIG